jgi:hypothetical protein
MPVIGIEECPFSQMYKNHLNHWILSQVLFGKYYHDHKSRKTNNDVSNRTRSKTDYADLHIGSTTRSKMHSVNNLSFQNLFFPLHDAILFQAHGKYQEQDFQLGVVECKVYHNVLWNTQYQVNFDCLLQLHIIDNTKKEKDMS